MWRGSALQLQIERKFPIMKFNFSSNKAASAARDAMMTIISIVTLSFNAKNGWSVMASTILGGGVTRDTNLLGFEFTAAQLKKAIKEAHARNKRVQPACTSERTTPCYSLELYGNMLIVEPVFPADIIPLHDKAGEGFRVELTQPVGTDASALEVVNALKAYDPAEPKRGEIIFSQHCVYNAGQLIQLAKALA